MLCLFSVKRAVDGAFQNEMNNHGTIEFKIKLTRDMKPILLALTMVNLLLPFALRSEVTAISHLILLLRYLLPNCSWIDVDGYGYCFQPGAGIDICRFGHLTAMVIGPTLTLFGWTSLGFLMKTSVGPLITTGAGPFCRLWLGLGARL